MDEAVEVEGVETERSRCGIASRARDGEIDGLGELGLWFGEATLLSGGLEEDAFAMLACSSVVRVRVRRSNVSLQLSSDDMLPAGRGWSHELSVCNGGVENEHSYECECYDLQVSVHRHSQEAACCPGVLIFLNLAHCNLV